MGGGNGAKAKQARERNAKLAKKGPTTQLGSNAQRIKCVKCYKLWMPQQETGAGSWGEHFDAQPHGPGWTKETLFTTAKA